MSDEHVDLHQTSGHAFESELTPEESSEGLTFEDLAEVRMRMSAELGTCTLLVREVLELRRGSILALNKLAGEMADIYVNDQLLAKGEVVVLGDTLHVRVAEIYGSVDHTTVA